MSTEYAFLLELRVVKPVPPAEQDKLDLAILAASLEKVGGVVLGLVEDQGYGCVALLPRLGHEEIGSLLSSWPGRHLVETRLRPVVPVRARAEATQ